MKLSAVLAFILVLGCKPSKQLQLHTLYLIPRNCSEVYSTVQPKYVAYDEPYRVRNWLGLYKWKVRTNYRQENQVIYKTRSICCYGYAPYDDSLCQPICSCKDHQVCIKPEHCECLPGYRTDSVTSECQAVCSEPCENGNCLSPENCVCKDGYRMLPDNHRCTAICTNCSISEICIEPHICKCKDGWTRSPMERLDRAEAQECKPVCERECVNADCVDNNRCRCHDGYENLNDDVFTCEAKCTLGCRDGKCSSPEKCTCFEGYTLAENSSHICEPVCQNQCINGTCIAPETCSCFDGYSLAENSSYICEPVCQNQCINGTCIAPETCSCFNGYSLAENSSHICEPVCQNQCTNGTCIAPETCSCFDGYSLAENSSYICEPVCQNQCINGECIAPDTCSCFEDYEFKNSTYENPDSSTPQEQHPHKCIIICKCDKGYCNETSSTCNACLEGYDLTYVENSTICHPHCQSGCRNGRCIETEYCECEVNYKSDYTAQGHSICVHACGGDCKNGGTCLVDNGTCSCTHGWTGGHCEDASLCSVSVSENQTLYSQLNEYENLTIFEETWTGPICSSHCLRELTKTSNCYYEDEATMIICFLDIKSQCNFFEVMQANFYRKNSSILSYVVYSVSLLTLVTVGTILTLFVMRKRNSVRSIEMMKTINATQRLYEHDCLIENDNSGISL